jgi:3-hydroxybutyryl-CoA dehydrogenase
VPHAAPVLAIIGAGTAGRRFALACAAAGFDVILEDVMPANLRRAQDEYQSLEARGNLSVALTVEEAVHKADIAIDFVPDELESKLEIFSLLDRMAPPRTIFCTPSEALSITDLASCVYRPDRCFALRGDLTTEAPIRILYPESHNPEALSAVAHVFESLGRPTTTEPDPDVPMLMKNLLPSA